MCNQKTWRAECDKSLKSHHQCAEFFHPILCRQPYIYLCQQGASGQLCVCVVQVTSSQPNGSQGEIIPTRREIPSVVLETRNRAARLEQEYRDLKRKRRKQARKKRKVIALLPLTDSATILSSSTHERVLQRRGRMWYVV